MQCVAPQPLREPEAGLSYVEVLVATLLIALALLPALDALRTGILGGQIHTEQTVLRRHLASKLEEVLARPWSALEYAAGEPAGSPSWLSDPLGTADRRLVYVRGYDLDDADDDADPFSGADEDVFWIRAEVEQSALSLEVLSHRAVAPP